MRGAEQVCAKKRSDERNTNREGVASGSATKSLFKFVVPNLPPNKPAQTEHRKDINKWQRHHDRIKNVDNNVTICHRTANEGKCKKQKHKQMHDFTAAKEVFRALITVVSPANNNVNCHHERQCS